MPNRPPASYCFFTVYGKDLRPKDVTLALNRPPDDAASRGDMKTVAQGTREFPYKHGFWSLHTQKHVFSDELNPHLRWLMETLDTDALRTVEAIERVDITVVAKMPIDQWGFDIPPEFVRFAAGTNATLGISIAYWPPEANEP